MAGRFFLFFLFALTLAKPIAHRHHHRKRYDLDGNGVADYCSVEGVTARCLQENGTWTSFPVSDTTESPATVVPTLLEPASTSISPSTSVKLPARGALPDAAAFKADNGTKWSIDYVGELKFSSGLNLQGDKGRTSKIGDKIIWNFGDMQCPPDFRVCGFGYGPAFYSKGVEDLMTVDTDGVKLVQDNDFLQPWSNDPAIEAPFSGWGMDTTNIAEINSTHGVVYGMEAWRGDSAGAAISDRGLAVGSVTLGRSKPVATRLGPLISNGDAMTMGMIAILRDGDYVYSYTPGGDSGLVVGRVKADDSVFDASKYQFLQAGTANTWLTSGHIPLKSELNSYGVQRTDDSLGSINCPVYGSIYYNKYLQKYTLFCYVYMELLNMFVADNPWGPWSQEYNLMSGFTAYGAHAHPEFSSDGSDKSVLISYGNNDKFHMFNITFDY